MSNYLLIIAESHAADAAKAWMKRLGSSPAQEAADVVDVDLVGDRRLLYIARNGQADLGTSGREILRGYAVDFDRSQLVFGMSGLDLRGPIGNDYSSEPAEGCYLAARWDENRATISNDLFGMCALFSFAEADCVAFSDSVFLLSRLRKALNFTNTINTAAAEARAWGNAMAGQMISPDSLINEIEFLPTGVAATVSFDGRLHMSRVRNPLTQIFDADIRSGYGESLKKAAQRFVSLVDALAGTGFEALKLSVSGGLDSRVCMAAAQISPRARDAAVLNCIRKSQQHSADYEVVEELSDRFDFVLGSRDPGAPTARRTRSVRDNLGFWFLASSGAYDFMVAPTYYSVVSDGFTVGGHGAEAVKGNYGWRSIAAIANKIPDPLIARSFAQQAEYGIGSLGIDIDSPVGSEWHYLAYRNAIHSGRISTVSMTGFRPFQMRELVALAHSPLNPFPSPAKAAPSMVNDLLIAIHPAMAGHRFDDPHKNMSHDYIQERLRAVGGPLTSDDISEFVVFGQASEVSSGFSVIFKNIVEDSAMWLPASREIIGEMALTGYGVAADLGLGEVYRPLLDEAILKLADESLPLNFMRGAAGKLLAFHLLT